MRQFIEARVPRSRSLTSCPCVHDASHMHLSSLIATAMDVDSHCMFNETVELGGSPNKVQPTYHISLKHTGLVAHGDRMVGNTRIDDCQQPIADSSSQNAAGVSLSASRKKRCLRMSL